MGGLRRLAQRASDRAARHVVGRLVAGQPVHETHPHLLGQDELLPGLSRDEFAQRRRALAQAMPRNSIAVLPGAPPQFVTGIIPHAYRQVVCCVCVGWYTVGSASMLINHSRYIPVTYLTYVR